MKKTLLLILLLTQIREMQGQELIIRQSDTANCFSFIKIKDGHSWTYRESYAMLSGMNITFLVKWGVAGDGQVYWTNGENIYWFNPEKTMQSQLLHQHLFFILEFVVRGDFIYVVYNPSKGQDPGDNRYAPGIRLCRIQRKTGVRENLPLPTGYNVTNLTISPDGQRATFIHSIVGTRRCRLVLYDLVQKQVSVIDSSDVRKETWFGDPDKNNTACWTDTANLVYYKHTDINDYGRLMTYDVSSNSAKVWMDHFPQRDFTWFAVAGGYFYCSHRQMLYRTKDGVKKEVLFKDDNVQRMVLDGAVLVAGAGAVNGGITIH